MRINGVKTGLRNDGYTLVEMIVAITLFGLISLVLFAGFDLTMRSWKQGQKKIEADEQVRSVFELVRRQISSVYPVVPEEEDEPESDGTTPSQPRAVSQSKPYFIGFTDRTAFISLFSLRVNAIPGLCFVAYAIEPSEEGKGYALVEYEKQYTGINPMGSDQAEHLPENIYRYVLLDNLDSATFHFYGYDYSAFDPRNQDELQKAWYDSWDVEEKGDLPLAVRLDYHFLPDVRTSLRDGSILVPIRSHGSTLRPRIPVTRRPGGTPKNVP